MTTTVTEAGYRRAADGGLDRDDPEVAADIAALREHGADADVVTAPGKLALGLAVRRAHDLPGVAVVPCDNVPDNGAMVARVVGELAAAADPGLAAWIAEHVSFVTTMVDRITPHTTDDDREAVRERAGVDDPVPVVTEPYVEWVLSGEFPQGRPHWDAVGARFVDDVVPWEHRKLWLLNGSHSLMAYAATIRGHETVEQAISDPVVRGWVEQWWDDAARHLPLPRRGHRGLPRRAAGALREPADPPPAAPDRRGRLPEGADPDPADRAGRPGRRAACRRVRRGCSPRGCATCAGRAPRSRTWRPRSSPRSPRATSTTPWAAC